MRIKSISAVLTLSGTPVSYDITPGLCEVVCFTGNALLTIDQLANPAVLPAGASRDIYGTSVSLTSADGATAQVLIYEE